MHKSKPGFDRKFVETRSGPLHIAVAGEGFPVLLLHQMPRSWDEFRDVLPALGQNYRAIAMDTVGFGDSESVLFENSVRTAIGVLTGNQGRVGIDAGDPLRTRNVLCRLVQAAAPAGT